MSRSNYFKKFFSSNWTIAIFVFLLAVAIRAIPEIKAGHWPIGYDTFNTYAAVLTTYKGSLVNWLLSANLIYFVFLPFKAIGFKPEIIMKLCGPLFFGTLAAVFYLYLRQGVKFTVLKSLLGTLLLIVNLAFLRLSWDLYRNELGLIFLFLILINLPEITKLKNLIWVIIFSVFLVLSNELVTTLLLVILFVYALVFLFKKEYEKGLRLFVPLIVSASIFLVTIFTAKFNLYNNHIIFLSDNNSTVWHYLYEYQKVMSLETLTSHILQVFWLYYRYLIVFAPLGLWLLRKNIPLLVMTLWLVFGTFSALLFRGTGLIVWDRWLIMLVSPLVVYAVEEIFTIGVFINLKLKKWHIHLKPMLITLAIIFWAIYFGLFLQLAIPFLSASYPNAKPPLANDALNDYFPRTMVHNAVGIWKIENVLDCVVYLNEHVPDGGVVLVDNRYRGLMMTNFDLKNRYIVTTSWSADWPEQSYEMAKSQYEDIYLIWAVTSVPGFGKIYSKGNVGVYRAKPH